MRRAVGILGTILLLLLSFGLYQGVYRVKAQEKELKELDANIVKEAEAIRVLKAEWSYLNQPERLQSLAQRHLALAPTAASQIVIMANLPERGPAIAPPVASVDASQLPFKNAPAAAAMVPTAKAAPARVAKPRVSP